MIHLSDSLINKQRRFPCDPVTESCNAPWWSFLWRQLVIFCSSGVQRDQPEFSLGHILYILLCFLEKLKLCPFLAAGQGPVYRRRNPFFCYKWHIFAVLIEYYTRKIYCQTGVCKRLFKQNKYCHQKCQRATYIK